MIVLIHSFEVKLWIVRLAVESRGLTYVGKWISIYSDLSAELLKQRETYKEVRSQLRKLNLGFIHPTKHILTFQNTTHTCSTAREAKDFFDKHIKSNTQGDELTDLGAAIGQG